MTPRTRSSSARRSAPTFSFDTINHTALWGRLALTATQLSRLTGISRRQVEWWRRRGYLPTSPDEPDRFNGDAVTLALLIKQGLDAGIPLGRANDLAKNHLAETLSRGLLTAAPPGEYPDQSAMFDLEQKLLASYNTIGLVLKAIAPLVQRVEREFSIESESSEMARRTT